MSTSCERTERRLWYQFTDDEWRISDFQCQHMHCSSQWAHTRHTHTHIRAHKHTQTTPHVHMWVDREQPWSGQWRRRGSALTKQARPTSCPALVDMCYASIPIWANKHTLWTLTCSPPPITLRCWQIQEVRAEEKGEDCCYCARFWVVENTKNPVHEY